MFYCIVGEIRKAGDLLQEKDNGSPLYSLAKVWYRLWNAEEEDKAKL